MFIKNRDRNIHYRLDGNPDGPRLLLLNSLGTSLDSWDRVVALLADAFHILRIDKSGHGQSEPNSSIRFIADNSTDVLAVMDHLSWDRANVCGISIGGMTALDMAINHPARLERIIFSNTSAYVSPEHLIERCALIREFNLTFVAAQVVGRFFLGRDTVSTNNIYVEAVRDFIACDGGSYIGWCEAIIRMDFRDVLMNVASPSLVITGVHDMATPTHMGRLLHTSIRGSKMIELPCGHIPYMHDHVGYARIIREFMRD